MAPQGTEQSANDDHIVARQARDERETTTMSYDNVTDAAGDRAGKGGKGGDYGVTETRFGLYYFQLGCHASTASN